MTRKVYDLFERPIERFDTKAVATYVKCDCQHLAIRQKGAREFFKCSLCKKEYTRNKVGEIVLLEELHNKN
ncbi:transcriptional regulator [Enterococcus faecalis]|uniref:transcriptional regulator n=1 Tax=Enterococcus faecalis TaxID=1351 RepID=UPI001E502D65|nr:transcriptional regulator [Enterococcus faecalis]MCD4912490.1 transcriptional regulator [Enterococcus faecalis]